MHQVFIVPLCFAYIIPMSLAGKLANEAKVPKYKFAIMGALDMTSVRLDGTAAGGVGRLGLGWCGLGRGLHACACGAVWCDLVLRRVVC
jgi:hypothetical protein